MIKFVYISKSSSISPFLFVFLHPRAVVFAFKSPQSITFWNSEDSLTNELMGKIHDGDTNRSLYFLNVSRLLLLLK